MTKELRRLSILMLIMFLALFASTTFIQGVDADALGEHPANKRALYDSYEIQRGSIVASGSAIASSVPSSDLYSFQRVYTNPQLWSSVTGFYNPVLNSARALESVMGSELSGAGNTQFFNRLDQIISGQPPRGASIQLSLDASVQQAAADALGDLQGAVVAIEPSTGRVLAMYSSPGYDPNTLAVHDADAVNAAYAALDGQANTPLINRAIEGNLNPPGSTFKLVVAAAALQSGKYTPQTPLPNPAVYTLPQSTSTVHNASGGSCGSGDTVTIADALRLSCNIPFAELAVALGDDTIRAMAENFGFNSGFDIPLSVTASVYPAELDAPQTALSGFGQSDVRVTPLQMAMVSAAIANGGAVMQPSMVDAVIAPDLSVLSKTEPKQFRQAIDSSVAKTLASLMVADVSDGVASGATIDGVDVGGKTGTAENGNGPYSLWFTGFAPAENPKVAVAVVVENGGGMGQSGSGDAIASPIAKQVMEAVLNR